MYAIQLIGGVAIPGLFGGTVVVPGIGAFIAMLLIAALVGSGLGRLRQATSPHSKHPAQHSNQVPVPPF